MKISLIGHPGSGKTYLTEQLGQRLKLEVIDIDILFDKHPLYFVFGFLYRRKLNDMFQDKSDWIIDGYHGKRMPDWIWIESDKIIFLDLPKDDLKSNVKARQRLAKKAGEFSHWQSSRINNIKNYGQIKFFDDSLRKNFKRIIKISNGAEIIILQSKKEVEDYIKLNAE